MFTSVAYAQEKAASNVTPPFDWCCWHPLFLSEVFLLFVIFVLAISSPFFAQKFFKSGEDQSPLRGLGLPSGSVRAILALLIVGSFVNVLVFGSDVFGDKFEQVITAFGTLAGAVTGFYFAGRTATPPPKS